VLLVESPQVASYVRSLRIEVITQSGSGYDFALRSPCGDEISPLLCKLTRLESLTLAPRGMSVMWDTLGDVFRAAFFKTLCQPTIKAVSILNIARFPLSLLDDCKTLQSLSLQGAFLDIDLESTSPYPRLQSLRIIDQLSSQVFHTRLFTSWAKTNSIRSLILKLSMHWTCFIDKHMITCLLQAYSGSLTTLRVDFPDYVGKSITDRILVIPTLSIVIVVGTELDVEQITLIRELADTLASLPHLERITFYVSITISPQASESEQPSEANDIHPAVGQLLSALPSTFNLSIYFRLLFPQGSIISWSSLILNFLIPPTFQRPAEIFVKALAAESSGSLIPLLHLDASLSRLVREGVILLRADDC
jgi:hypothetical protein